jgi:hypothetical protein
MILNLVVLAVTVAIVFMQSIFGVFSGIINLVSCVVATATAFGFYESLSLWASNSFGLHPAYCEATIFFLLFFGTLMTLRGLADAFIRGNVSVPMYVDWGGAAVCGFLSAQLCVGALIISILLLPMGGSVMGFQRLERTDNNNELHRDLIHVEENHLWLRPDEFAGAVAGMLSAGSLSGPESLNRVYPDVAEWAYWSGNTVQWNSSPTVYRDKKGDGFKDGLKVEIWWIQNQPVAARYRREAPTAENSKPTYSPMPFSAAEGMQLLGVRLRLDRSAADRDKNRTIHLFRPSMLRIVGDIGEGDFAEPAHYPVRVLAGADADIGGHARIVDFDSNIALEDSGETLVDAYFEVPTDFHPRFVEYRRRARAALIEDKELGLPADKPPLRELVLLSPAEQAAQQARGVTRFIDQLESPSGENRRLPFKLSVAKAKRGESVEVTAAGFASGRIMGEQSRFEPDAQDDATTEDFVVPEGSKLCQIRFKPRKVASLPGQVFNYVARTVNQYRVIDNTGESHPLCGYYAIIKRSGRDYVELFYTGEPRPTAYRSMLDFKAVKPEELTGSDDVLLGLLFLLPPGRTVVSVQNQGGEGLDLSPGLPISP